MPRLSKVFSAELEGVDAKIIEVEVDLHAGLHSFTIVGLADKALNEAKERVGAAIKNSGAKPPNRDNRKITVNLAPADIKKTGSQYDLAIAIGYLLATEQMSAENTDKIILMGELALDGRLRPINGALNIAEMARRRGFEYVLLPEENVNEASAIGGIKIIPLGSLRQAMEFLEGKTAVAPHEFKENKHNPKDIPDFAEVRGQENAKRAMTIAAAGGHNLLMVGPPGVGKSMLAQALGGILPSLTREEAIQITKIWSAAGISKSGLVAERPFRSPHQTASLVSVVGGGSDPKPGEISLAHRGILFLDELPEFPKQILEALRAPLEAGVVHIARAKQSLSFPAKFSLVAAMNPCPCGFYGDEEVSCRCSAADVLRYQKKISGPLLDRIDLQVRVPRLAVKTLQDEMPINSASSYDVKRQVEMARLTQAERFSGKKIVSNAEMSSKETEKQAFLTSGGKKFLSSLEKAHLSPRGYYRLLKTARTIADLEKSEETSEAHLAEAFSYRLRES